MSQGFPGNNPNPYGQQPSGAPNPYSQQPNPYSYSGAGTGPYGPPPKSSRTAWIISSIVGGVALIVCAGCCGGFAMLAQTGLNEQGKALADDFRQDAQVRQEVGEIQEVTFNWSATIGRSENEDELVYDVRGDKGSAQFLVVTDDDNEPISTKLKSSRGEWNLPTPNAGEQH